ncbi:hypothetical protein [Candidatus Poriferisodalis sp.]|uniref:hypothetical protein n=1 Tax=Candidatus Poriferisodalis sp. TaxID=3101277 RepID=UPI003AF8BF6C
MIAEQADIAQACSAASKMYEAERQAREMFAEPTHVADLIGDIGTAVAFAQSTLAETVQTGIERAVDIIGAIDTNRYNTVESLSLTTANRAYDIGADIKRAADYIGAFDTNRYNTVESLSLTTANRAYDIGADIKRAADYIGAFDTNRYNTVESLSLTTANRAYDIGADIKRAADYIGAFDTNRYNTVESLGLTAARAVPSASAAWSRNPDAVLDEPLSMPTQVHDTELAPADDDSDATDPLVVLLACLVALAGLLLSAHIANPEQVIPQTRLWVTVFGNAMLHSPEFHGWMYLTTFVVSLIVLQRQR